MTISPPGVQNANDRVAAGARGRLHADRWRRHPRLGRQAAAGRHARRSVRHRRRGRAAAAAWPAPWACSASRADGRIAIDYTPQLISAADPYAVGLLNANGSLDSAYAATSGNGFRGLSGLVVLPTLEMPDPVSSTATPFLDADGSIVVAVASRHEYDNDPHVRFGLRRIQPDGEYDTAFGLGVPSIAAPAAVGSSPSSSRSPARTPTAASRPSASPGWAASCTWWPAACRARSCARRTPARPTPCCWSAAGRATAAATTPSTSTACRRSASPTPPRLHPAWRAGPLPERARGVGRGRTGRDGAERRRQRDGHHVNRGAPPRAGVVPGGRPRRRRHRLRAGRRRAAGGAGVPGGDDRRGG